MSHSKRAKWRRGEHALLTLKLCKGSPDMRNVACGIVITDAIREVGQREGFEVFQFSIQGDHVHLIVRAVSAEVLANAMKSLGSRLARRLNALWGRTGRLFAERFHAVAIRTLRRLWHTVRYVLCNHNKHGRAPLLSRHAKNRLLQPDQLSSGGYFDGWSDCPRMFDPADPEAFVARPSWPLRESVRRYGRFSVNYAPKRA